MSQYGESPDPLESARRALAARDADLAAADRALADAVAEVHAIAVASIRRLDAIGAELDAIATAAPNDSPSAAHELSRYLIAKNRDIAAVVNDAKVAAQAKAIVLKELSVRYR